MSSVLLLTLAFLSLVTSRGTRNHAQRQQERELAQLFLQNIPNASEYVRHVPSYVKKLYQMQDHRPTFSQVSCVFSEDQKPLGKRRLIFSFDLSNIKNLPKASQVHLRVFKRRSKQRNSREFYHIHLYQIFGNNINSTFRENKHLLSSRFVGNSRGEWLAFDLTSEFNSQENIPTTTKSSFLLEVKAAKERSRSKTKPVSIAAKSGRKQPYILVFFQIPPKPLQASEVKNPVVLSLDKSPFVQSRFPRVTKSLDRLNKLCSRRQPLYINFFNLGIRNIIAPPGYEAYYCAGTCPVFSGKSQSVYSFLRNRQRLASGNKIPAACCVPTKLDYLYILYFAGERNIEYKRFEGMVVSSCGCR